MLCRELLLILNNELTPMLSKPSKRDEGILMTNLSSFWISSKVPNDTVIEELDFTNRVPNEILEEESLLAVDCENGISSISYVADTKL